MPKKRDAADAQGDWWLKETKDRLDKVAAEMDQGEDKSAPPELAWMRAGTQDLEAFRRGSPQAGGKPPLVRSGEETAELMYRSSNEGLVCVFIFTLAEANAKHFVWEPIAPDEILILPGDHSDQ